MRPLTPIHTYNEIDRASFQAVNHRLSVLFIHKERDGETHYVCERTSGTTVFTVKSPQVSFMRWMLLRIEELTIDLGTPE